MPEGPEVKTVTLWLNKKLCGYKLQNIIVSGSFSYFRNGFSKQILPLIQNVNFKIIITKICSKGKFIYIELTKYKKINNEWIKDGYKYIGNHLGLNGHWNDNKVNNADITISFIDKEEHLQNIYCTHLNNFGKLNILESKELRDVLIQLGPDILSDAFTEDIFLNQIKKYKNHMICDALLNQSIISGIGNYLRTEILYDAKIYPKTKICKITNDKLMKLYNSIKNIATNSFMQGGSINEYGNYIPLIYKKENDPIGNPIEIITVKSRSIYYVPLVQIQI